MRFQVLGGLQVERDHVELDVGSRKQRVLLAALLLERGRSVPAARLVDLVWEQEPPAQAEASLQSYVSRLRRVLEQAPGRAPEVLVTRSGGYALLVPDDAVDAHVFAGLAAQAATAMREQRWDEATVLASRALRLWRGPLLPEMAHLPFTVAEARRLETLQSGCREVLVVAALGQDRVVDAVAEAESWAQAARDDERAQWLVALALHRAGRTAEALERIRAYRERLGEETGLTVGRELESLQASLLAHDPQLDRWPAGAPAPASIVPEQRSAAGSPTAAAYEPGSGAARRAMVGRDAELVTLDAAVASCSAEGRWVVLVGPAGIGKSSLAAVVAEESARAVWARCPDDTVPAWWPVRQLVRGLGGSPDALLAPPAGADADAARFTLYERVAQCLLSARPANGPLAVVVDDVQWADDASLGCLSYLAQAVPDARLLIVLTLRDDEVPRAALQHLLATLARGQRTVRIAVPPLGSDTVAEVVKRLTGEPVEPADAALLALRTGGNPLFVTEYARLPEAERREGLIPVAAQQLLERRLARLPDEVVEVLRVAAVVGEDFDLATVAAAAGCDVEELVGHLDPAMAAQVVVAGRAAGAGYGFGHALLRDAVLAALTLPRRQLLHARVADVLADRTDPELLARRAGHLRAAGPVVDPETVRAACAAVARDAERRLEFSAAAHWWVAALEVRPEGDDELELELQAVRALARSGRPDQALLRVGAAFGRAIALGDTGTAARLAEELVHVQDGWTWTVFGEPRPALLDALLAALELVREPAHRVPLLGAAVAGLHLFTRVEERLPYAEEAVQLAQRSGDPELLRSAHAATLKSLIQVPFEIDRAWAAVHDLEAALGPVQDRRAVLLLQTRADLLLLQGEVAASHATHLRTVALSDALRLPGYRAQERWAATRYAQWSGQDDRAEALIERARQLHEQTGVQYAAGAYAQSLLSLRWHQGRVAEVPEPHVDLTRGFNYELWQALRAHERGEPDRARTWAEQVPEERQHWWGMLPNLVLNAHVVCAVGMVDRAEALLAQLLPHTGLLVVFGHFGCAGPVDLALGRLLLLLGRTDEATVLLRRAHEHAVREGGRPFARQAAALLAEAGHAPAETVS